MPVTPRRVARADTILIVAGLVAVAILSVAATRPGRQVLTVWSCGSNYESLSDFSREFEARHACRVRYTAAPVQYLLEHAMETPTPPDVIVGRAGPGWEALRQAGKLGQGPVFFAMDPYVIITPRGNPAGIENIADLGREGVKVAAAPTAMRPRGKCAGHLMASVSEAFYPGLVERWENNCSGYTQCGRKLADPVVAGKVDAAVVPLCMTSFPGVAGKVEVIPIAAKHLLSMKQCRATIPQCCGILSNPRQPELARQYVADLQGDMGRSVFTRHGYLPLDSPAGRELKPLITVFTPQDQAGWQVHMAMGLYEDGALLTALRRFMVVTHTFGPNHYQARARFWAGKCLQALGNDEAARQQWQRVIDEFPRKGKLEWESRVLHVGKPVPGVEKLPETHWVRQAREALASAGGSGQFSPEHKRMLEAFKITHEPVMEGDPDKNGTRDLQLGKDLLEMGHYTGATRDLLKVLTIDYPSRHMRQARFWLGVTSYLRELPGVAVKDWQELSSGDDRWAAEAKKALNIVRGAVSEPASEVAVPMPPWEPAYETHAQRGMSYGMALWEHHLPLHCFKEMGKIISGIYGKPAELAAMARYRMGVCCVALDKPQAAYSQWTMLKRCYPGATRWVKMTAEAQAKLPPEARRDLPFVGKLSTDAAIAELKKPPKSSFGKRFRLAEEMFNVDLLEGDSCLLEYWKVMTVTDPSQEKNKQIRPMAEYKAGLVCRKSGREEAARRHLQNVVDKYPRHKAAGLAARALAKGGR